MQKYDEGPTPPNPRKPCANFNGPFILPIFALETTKLIIMDDYLDNGAGDIFLAEVGRRIEIFEKVQAELMLASQKIVKRMAKAISVSLNKSMSSYVDEILAYRKMNFIDMISIKHQSMAYAEMLFGFEEDLETRIEAQINALSQTEWLVFQFREASKYYEGGRGAVVSSIKKDVFDEFGRILDEHYHTKRMQHFLERYPWLKH